MKLDNEGWLDERVVIQSSAGKHCVLLLVLY
jgi:hypothetical protein